MKNFTIVIADDHPLYRESLIAAINRIDAYKDCICLEAENGLEILKHLKQSTVDMVITDIGMPEMDGMQAIEKIKKKYPDIKIVIVSQYDDYTYTAEAMRLNVNGYLTKNTGIEEMTECFYAVKRGMYYFNPELVHKVMSVEREHGKPGLAVSIGRKQEAILKLLCEEYSNEEIASILNISVSTVKTHRNNLYVKTNSKTAFGLAIYAIKHKLFHVK